MLRVWLSSDEAALRSGRSLITPGLVGSTPPVDQYNRIATDDPGVVALGQRGDCAGSSLDLGAVLHGDVQDAAGVLLEVGCFTQLGAGDRLDVIGPTPTGLEDEAADLASTDGDEIDLAPFEGPGFIG
jgi:hypothetical protein